MSCRIGGAIHDHLALVHYLAVVYQRLLALGDQDSCLLASMSDPLLAFGFFTKRNRTRDFRQHAGVFQRTR